MTKFFLNIAVPFLILLLPSTAKAAPTITNVTDNRSSYTNSAIPRYEKFEISFQISGTTATNLQFPYDAAPPSGIAAASGISVDAEFSRDNFQTVIKQPAFYYQDFNYQVLGTRDWMYPLNSYNWKVRFAPNQEGNWQYRIRALDQGGETVTNAVSFNATTSDSHGFVKVSSRDSRYFEFDDGTYFPGLGYNMNFSQVSWDDPVQGNLNNFNIMQQNGIQFIRIWLSQWSIFGGSNSSWRSALNGSDYEGLNIMPAGSSSELSLWMKWPDNPAMFQGWMRRAGALKRNTDYQITVRYQIPSPLQGPRFSEYPYGLVVKMGGWLSERNTAPATAPDPSLYTHGVSDPCQEIQNLSWGAPECYYASSHVTSSPVDLNGNPQWSTFSGTFNSGNQDFMDNFYLTLDNVNVPDTSHGAVALVDRIEVREVLGNGQYGSNIINKEKLDQHMYFDQQQSYSFDKVVELAKQKDIYLRPALIEKTDWILGRILFDGTISPTFNYNNFYGDWRRITRGRWLQLAWFRYVQARWGYATSIHSWELLNEGDPYHGVHYTLTDELGKFMHCGVFGISVPDLNGDGGGGGDRCLNVYDHPNDHPVSTSTWHSFPIPGFWGSANYPNVDFADVHQYIFEQDTNLRIDYPSLGNSVRIYDQADYPNSSIHPYKLSQAIGAKTQPYSVNKPVIRGETGWVSGSTDGWIADLQRDTNGVWLHNFIWGQINAGGVYDSGYWYPQQHIYYRYNNVSYDHRPHFGAYYRFIKDIPVNNGYYVDASTSSTNPEISAWGQKDLTNKTAHLWINNRNNTWRNAINSVAITPHSSTITVSGFTANNSYPVEWWDTYTGQVSNTETQTANTNGEIILEITDLTTDKAVKIGDYSVASTGTPTPSPLPGDVNGDRVVNILDYTLLSNNFGTNNTAADINDDGIVNILDYTILSNNFGRSG